ncbi:MAG: DUF3696 domain-containing protein [Magnetococcales bacterium]|nr:DUF3696 domain-containing protein [Magnetococcales bacterium]NGZ26731.1 DUF3696 domain-containing protein [Magnetococcales bacterium]
MLTKLTLEGFKCYKKFHFPLNQLTLLTGFNGGGKSTALQGILLLAQGLREYQEAGVLALNGRLVQLGTPREVMHTGVGATALTLEDEQCKIRWLLHHAREQELGAVLGVSSLEVSEEGQTHHYGGEEVHHLAWSDGVHHTHGRKLLQTIRDTLYLSAVRHGAAETFPNPAIHTLAHADVGSQGEYAPWWFQRFMDEEIPLERCHPGEKAINLRRQFQAWASLMFPGVEANAVAIPEISQVRLELRMSSTEPWRRPANTGYGISYAFPILVSCLLAKPGQLVIIDSPEAHLHPKGQSHMGYFLAKMAAAGVQIAIETHSDHVLNGVRLAVKDCGIPAEKVILHFFHHHPDRNSPLVPVTAIHLDQQGQFSDAPDGFFDQLEKDLSHIAGWG